MSDRSLEQIHWDIEEAIDEEQEWGAYWQTRNLWMNPRSGAVEATCNRCGQEAVLCTLDGIPIRAYHPAGVKYPEGWSCAALVPIEGKRGAPLSADILPRHVTAA